MRAAGLGAFVQRVSVRTADAFYVRINKDLTLDERKRALKDSRERFRELQEQHPERDKNALRLLIIKQELAAMKAFGRWKDPLAIPPLPEHEVI